MKYTANYNLKKPEGTDVVNIDDLNENADIIDQKLKELEDGVYNAPPDSVDDAAIGSRTPDQSQAPASPGTGTLTQLISWLANRIKAITGKTNWWDAPPTTLQAAKTHMDAAAPHSGHETPSGAQAKANTAEANAKAYTNAHEQKAAPHSGHETPAGAQAKADAAETSAKSYADNIGTALSGIIGSLGSLLTTVKTNIVAAINSLKNELDAHKADNAAHGITSKVSGPSSAINGNIAIFDGTTGKKVKDSGITLTTNKGSVLITDTVTSEGKTITIPIGAGKRRGLFVMHVPDKGDKAIVFFGTYEDGAVCIYRYSGNVYVMSEGDAHLANYVTGSNGAYLTRAYISGSNLCLEFNSPSTANINCYVKWEVW